MFVCLLSRRLLQVAFLNRGPALGTQAGSRCRQQAHAQDPSPPQLLSTHPQVPMHNTTGPSAEAAAEQQRTSSALHTPGAM